MKSIAEDLYITSKPEYMMTAAEIYFSMGDNKKSKELCFKILYNLNLEDVPIEYAIRTVSYTHLDVYKRQRLDS